MTDIDKMVMDSLCPTTNVEGRVFVTKEITDCMQMRIMYDGDYTGFECGVDIITTDNGSHLIVTNTGLCAKSFTDLAYWHVRYHKDIRPFKYILFCDDSMSIDKDPVYIEDDKLMSKAIKI